MLEPQPSGVPGLRYLPDWINEAAADDLRRHIDAGQWSTQLRRRVQHYGHRYDYGRRSVGQTDAAPPIPAWLDEVVARLVDEKVMDQPADQVIVNEYLPGQGISAHVDCVPCFGPVVAAISLESGCVMDFTEPDTGVTVPVRLEPRSLCVMTGPARYRWRHAIAARKSDPGPSGRVPRERRVSVTFRTVLSPAETLPG
ncbi:alpha-ketoglutarate-dependent dioxygenase AlkB [Stackebrandtia nassauensis]|uniref:2OG-Fe(II) oxygenase n=1 Tax=Stackebrandtia nassauensis (strain DSM 44728 / CIP 108903 / NRRL B-16338 / NBRC 102104 / LLR-40K-21) TaxID=446470 RepID=D3Q101_STANL|nr:alpha-ketoglutarate-dependent dioxygenase AlkB [Stackebrandtia nassauensis]ADD43751.1 2OG-Fe(II) oxygenase [Stackebrandtia nassauensis DSM 44728]